MHFNRYILLLLGAGALMSACTKEFAPEQKAPAAIADDSPFVEGEVIVRFDENMTSILEEGLSLGLSSINSSELKAAFDNLGVTSVKRAFPDAGEFEPRHREWGLHTFYTLSFDQNTTKAAAKITLENLPGAISVDRVRKSCSTSLFNDPRYSYQWYCNNNGSLSASFTQGADINIETVWEAFTTGREDVIVAVIDGGIDGSHPDLAANYAGGENFCSDLSGSTKVVPHTHGTLVAGIIGAVNNNGQGICGIAGGDAANNTRGVKLLSCQIFEPNPHDAKHDFSSNEHQAIVWACDQGAVIAQNSWSYKYATQEEADAATIPDYLKQAVDYFIANAGISMSNEQVGPMAGGVVLFAAGNNGWETNPICKYEPIISVGAISPNLEKAPYSNYGGWVDICAPGGNSNVLYGQIYSTVPGSYGYAEGTSMACPMVSGVAALIVSYFGGPGFTNEALLDRLLEGANFEATRNYMIGPLVDALGAFTLGDITPPETVKNISTKAVANNITATFKVTRDTGSIKAYKYKVLACKERSLLGNNLNFNNLPPNIISVDASVGAIRPGEDISITLRNLEFDTTYYIAVVGYDYNGNRSDISESVQVSTLSKGNPVRIYPNPVKDKLYVKTVEEDSSYVVIRSTTGQILFKKTFKTGPFSDTYIDLSSWAVGRYYIEITHKDSLYSQEIIKI